MKIAIIGSGPLALIAAKHFDDLGAHTVLFQRSPLGGNLRRLQSLMPELKIKFQSKELSLDHYFQTELVALVNHIEAQGLSRQGDVLRIHKRFLHSDERVEGKSRMHDLFRVVFSLNPKETILKQLEENPEMFKQLGADVVESLHRPVESFEDFDAVIEASGFGSGHNPMGAGGDLALNENNLQTSGYLFYQTEIFSKLNLENKKTLVLVGEGEAVQVTLLFLRDWLLKSADHTLHWVSYQELSATMDLKTPNLQNCRNLFNELDDEFEKNKVIFEKKMHEWRELEDYVKVKIPKPVEPLPKIRFYEHYDVTSVDRLLDREGVFATIEVPDFRKSTTADDLKTLAADAICVVRGSNRVKLASFLADNEPGYYKLLEQNLDQASLRIKAIEESLMTFFKKA